MDNKELKPYKAEYGIVPVVTRGGYPAEIIRVGMNALDGLSEYHVLAVVYYSEYDKVITTDNYGRYDGKFDSCYDLFIKPEKHVATRYQNIYRRANGHLVSGALCKTQERADNERKTFNGTWLCQQTIVIPKKQ